jgi:tRNA(Ile)-lysidine synthase
VDSFISRIERTILERKLLKAGQGILVAVSGGLDSMVLLRVLHSLAQQAGWRLAVAHLNHGLRGRAADLDEALVRRTALDLKLPVAIEKVNTRALAKRERLSVEMAARQARHAFLAETARSLRCAAIALAHHADDQLELFFLRLLRGSGGEGLSGMKWSNPSPADQKIELVRPFLNISKRELAKYARREKLAFREDASNQSRDILRNRVRHELLPLLRRRYQPGLARTVSRVSQIVGEEAEFAIGAARAWLGRNASASRTGRFENLAIAVQRRIIQIQLLGLGIQPDFEFVETLRTTSGRRISIPANPPSKTGRLNHSIFLDKGGRVRLDRRPRVSFDRTLQRIELSGKSGSLDFEGLKVDWRLINRTGASRARGRAGWEWFDAGEVWKRITLRHWKEGDRFQPIGMSGSVKLQDVFTDMKIPREQRHGLVVAATAKGHIYWVEGLRISERFKLKTATKRRLEWVWRRPGMPVAVGNGA